MEMNSSSINESLRMVYSPMYSSEGFRLINILPADQVEDVISAELLHCELQQPPSYCALSYTWGDPVMSHKIICNGQHFNVTKNLWTALRYLRSTSQSQCFWIDAICINQADVQERYEQVQKMPMIYRKAICVVFWLGRDNSDTSAAYQLLSHLVDVRRHVFQDWTESHSTKLKLNPGSSVLRTYRHQQNWLPHSFSGWKGLEEILMHTFFRRGWIIQDIICSQKAAVRCGPFVIPWTDFCYGLEAYLSYSYPNELKFSAAQGAQAIINIEKVRQQLNTENRLFLDQLVDLVRSSLATDSRDMVYVAFSIIKGLRLQGHYHQLVPDYNLTLPEVFLDAAWLISTQKEYGPFLSSMSLIEDSDIRRTQASDLPSWVPDFTVQLERYRFNSWENEFSASADIHLQLHVDGTRDRFNLSGLLVDQIEAASEYLPRRRITDKYNVDGGNSTVFLEWFEFAITSSRPAYVEDNDRFMIHWIETVQARGCDLWEALEPRAPSSLIAQAKSWLKILKDENQDETEDIRQFHAACLPSHERKFGITRRGNFCLLPRFSKPNDLVCIPFGSKVPFIIRPIKEDYINIGECYVHGAMHGEALIWEDIKPTHFIIR